MLNNKYLILISVLAIAAVIAVSVKLDQKTRKLPPVINALPSKVSFFIETEDPVYFLNKISKNKNLKDILKNNSLFSGTFNNILFTDSVLHKNKDLKRFINHKNVIFSAHPLASGKNKFLFITGTQNNPENKNIVKKVIKNIFPKTEFSKTKYDEAEIIHAEKPGKNIYFSFYKNYFLLSPSEILIQKSIKKINSNSGLKIDSAFKKLYEKIPANGDARIFINYETLFSNTGKIFNAKFNSETEILKNTAYWSAFNISLNRKHLRLSGHTILKPEMQFLSIFKNSKPAKNKVINLFPQKTSSFIILNIGNGSNFKYKYEDFLVKLKHLNKFQKQLAEFNKKYKLKPDETDLYSVTDNEIALIYEDTGKNGKNLRSYIFLKFNNEHKAKNLFEKIAKNTGKTTTYISEEEEYQITKLPVKNIPEIYFGSVFKNINAEYCTFINEFTVFGNSVSDLKEIIDAYEKDKTFKRKSPQYELIKTLPDESNLFFYADIYGTSGKTQKILNEKIAPKFKESIPSFKKIQGPAIQFIFDTYPAYTTIDIGLNSLNREISETVWEVKLDTAAATKPFIVKNHNTDEKEILIQDKAHKIYLIDKNGNILWTRQLDEKIISGVYQIDYYENNKLQLLFNTKNKIYGIDRKGNWLEGYPVKLKSNATNGLSLFDYENNRNYRIFVACKNKSVYLFDKNGEEISGWKFDKTQSEVSQKILHYKNEDKDYIVFRDKNNLYLLNRRGETRIKPEISVPLSENTKIWFTPDNINDKAHFAVSSPAGTVFLIYENGKIKKTSFKTYTKNHFFVYKDITGDNVPEYIFTDKNQTDVYDGKENKKIFSYTYNEDIINPVFTYKFGENDIRLGTSSNKKLYLINNKGKLCEGFPLSGTGLFSITIFDNNPEFSLITGNSDNYLYKYLIK